MRLHFKREGEGGRGNGPATNRGGSEPRKKTDVSNTLRPLGVAFGMSRTSKNIIGRGRRFEQGPRDVVYHTEMRLSLQFEAATEYVGE